MFKIRSPNPDKLTANKKIVKNFLDAVIFKNDLQKQLTS